MTSTPPDLDDLCSAAGRGIPPELRPIKESILALLTSAVTSRYKTEEEQQAYIQRILENPRSLTHLLDNLILLCKIDASSLSKERPPLSISSDIRDPIARYVSAYKARNLRLHFLFQPGIEMRAPRFEFVQALSHLAENACKFSPENGMIMVSLTDLSHGGFILTIFDQGEGIPPAHRSKAFERFLHIPLSSPELGGLGLGLPIVNALTHYFGGYTAILDTNKGCGIQVRFPPV